MIDKTATVTIKGSQVDAIGVNASLVLLIAVEAVDDTPELVEKLSNTTTPTPSNIPISTIKSTN
jgi:hypothetical protein